MQTYLEVGVRHEINDVLNEMPSVENIGVDMAWLTTKVKSKVFKGYADPLPNILLHHIKEYVIDTAHSKELAEIAIYDIEKVKNIVSRYYHGEHSLQNTVDWWLTFELWRQSIELKPS